MKDSDLPTSSTPAADFFVRVVQPETFGYSSRKTTIGNFAAGLTSLPKCATIYGGDGAGDDLTIKSTSHSTPSGSHVILQPTGGNVGVGTITPLAAFYISGNEVVILNNITPMLGATSKLMLNPSNGFDNATYYNKGPAIGGVTENAGTQVAGLALYTYNGAQNEIMRLTNTGNVGVGTTSPAEKLDVDGNFRATGNVTGSQIRARFDDGWGNGGIRFYDTSGNPSAFLGCFNNSNFAMRLGTNGNGLEIINGAGTAMIAKISDNGLVRCAALAWAISGTKTSVYTIGAADGTIVCDASGGNFTVTLPAASGNAGRIYIVKKTETTGVVTVDGNGSETIDGAADYALNGPNQVVRIQCNAAGTGWYTI